MKLHRDINVSYNIVSRHEQNTSGSRRIRSPKVVPPLSVNTSQQHNNHIAHNYSSYQRNKQEANDTKRHVPSIPTSPIQKVKNKQSPELQKHVQASQTPRIRKPRHAQVEENKWDFTLNCPDRDELILKQDNEISKFRKDGWRKEQLSPRGEFLGPKNEEIRKRVDFNSRFRIAKTSGPVANNIFPVHLPDEDKIRWNVMSKDIDDESRARPDLPSMKDSKSFHEHFRSKEKYAEKVVVNGELSDPDKLRREWSNL